MTSIGRYETVHELHHSGFTVLYSGRAADDPAEKFAIKVFQPSTFLLETEQVKNESELFLSSAHVQQKTAAGDAQYWAPIYECGSIPDGAFYVTDKYDHSLQQLIDVRVALTTQALCEIVESVAKGLVELKQACGRPHGNLKATNILIAGEGDISQAKIALSDPLPEEHIDTAVHWDSDLRDIAEFIYQLIIHRPSPAVDGWQVPDTKEWAKLGKLAKDWRNLCNRLLNAHIKPGSMTVETLIEELARLKKIKPVISPRRLLIAAGLIVIACVAILIIRPDIFPSKSANIRDWKQLFAEYVDLVEGLRSDLGLPKGNEKEKLWKSNKYLSIIVKKVNEASYPYEVAYDNNVLEQDLNKIETEEDIDDFNIKENKTINALIAIENIKYFFDPKADPNSFRFYNDPNSPVDRKEYQKWPLLVEIYDAADSFTKRGWQRSATYLQNLVDDVKPDPNIAVENVLKILELQPSLDDIKSLWTKIEDNQKAVEIAGEPILSRFRDYVNQEPALVLGEAGEADVNDIYKKLRDELWKREQLSSKLAKSIEDNWKKLEENQNIIKSTGNPTLAKFPDYIQSKLASADLDILGSELEQISSQADKLTKLIEDDWQKLEENQKTVENIGDPILAKYPDYIQSKLASADMGILDRELEQISRSVDNLAKSTENIWQKADKEAFLNDHGNDSTETLTDKTFAERLDIIKDYYFLVPDPRDELDELVNRTRNNIEEAKGYNPQPADECAKNLEQVQPDIEAMRKFRGIKKEQDEINKKINDLQPVIVKINEIAISLIETPKEWVQRISEDSRIASSEALNEKWIELRDKVIRGLTADELDKNKILYQTLRKRIKDTKENLVKLDEELLRGLPSQIDAKLEEKGWNRQLKEVYDEERKETIESILEKVPLHNEVPDISDPLLEEFRRNKFSEFEKRRNDFGRILEAFNKIEDGLDGCYLLSDELPEIDENIRSLWEKWRNTTTIREAKISEVLAILTERLARLVEIEESNDRQKLADIALGDESYTEAVYAAWLKLGELLNPPWPTETEDFDIDRRIQERLKSKFREIGDTDREGKLLTMLAETALEREIIFKKASIERFRKTVEQNHAEDKILADITRFVSTEINSRKTLVELEALENITNKLADYVSQEDWQKDKFRKDLFWAESDIYKSYVSISSNNLEVTVEAWSKEVEDYKIVEDPREGYQWNDKITGITQLIEDELRRKQAGASKQNLVSRITGITKLFEKALGGKQTGSAEQSVEKLKQEYDKLTETAQQINAMLALPAIEKNKEKFDTSICSNLWETLLNHEAAVRSIIKPEYCKFLELSEGKIQRLVFATTTEISADFEPINISRLQSITEKEPLLSAVFKFVQGSAESLLGFSRLTGVINKLPLSQLGELFSKTVEIAGWEQIRQAVKSEDTEWLSFFHAVDLSKTKNVGWPRYIVSKKDPSVILRFIPASSSNPEPFYMAIFEASNAQYRLFLEKTPAARARTAGLSTLFVDQNNNILIRSRKYEDPVRACKIIWDGKSFDVIQGNDDIPVTWVTHAGAQSYANWLGGQLPAASQHEYACRADTDNIHPWGNNLSEIANYAHVRGSHWRAVADDYNNQLINRDKIESLVAEKVPAPVGAKPEDFVQQKTRIDSTKTSHEVEAYGSAWPVDHAEKTNNWGLYDMIGNVWEWCQDGTRSVICGGSCLAPPEYVLLTDPSNYIVEFNETACDVGFRVVVPAK
ncbi:MAG TPA: SUMF1/EgtB/PvdO family nonheme iron enzyme [Sedimentisphaerales bacterium]|nr:SUMF1/EgtB/PvdO family nonheme iron enzyme [Sedimentisphaerales bacterium]